MPQEFKEALGDALAAAPASTLNSLVAPNDPNLLYLIHVVKANSEIFEGNDYQQALRGGIRKKLGRIIAYPNEQDHFLYKSQSLLGMGKPGADALFYCSSINNKKVKAPLYLALSCDATAELKLDFFEKLHSLIWDTW